MHQENYVKIVVLRVLIGKICYKQKISFERGL